jgi:hypothetical protein
MPRSDRAEGVDRDRLLRLFPDLVAIDSPTGHKEEIGKDLEARFSRLNATHGFTPAVSTTTRSAP